MPAGRALKDYAETLSATTLGSETYHWKRYSRRQDRSIPLTGDQLVWLIEGNLAPLMPLLVIGATTHAGGRATFGLGRFKIESGDDAQCAEV